MRFIKIFQEQESNEKYKNDGLKTAISKRIQR